MKDSLHSPSFSKRAYERLEEAMASFSGASADQLVACSSGSAALYLALKALCLEPGSVVIVPDFSMIALARACTLAGFVPVFADCAEDLNLCPRSLERVAYRERHRAKAVIAVHTYGRPCEMGEVLTVAKEYGLSVVEDLAECHGLNPNEGTDAACWSFYRNKVVHGEEGGAVWFGSRVSASLARRLRNMGSGPANTYLHEPGGFNFRMADCLAELVLKSLKQFSFEVTGRRTSEKWYDHECPSGWKAPPRFSPWVYDVWLPEMRLGLVDQMVGELMAAGIEARHSFKPLSVQPEYSGEVVSPDQWNWRAARASQCVLLLPLCPNLVQKGHSSRLAPPEVAKQAFDILKEVWEGFHGD